VLTLVSHAEDAPRVLLRLEKDWTDRQTDKRTDVKPLHYAYRLRGQSKKNKKQNKAVDSMLQQLSYQ